MSINEITNEHIKYFAVAYNIAKVVFVCEPINTTRKKQRKIRRWVEKKCIFGEDLPQEVLRLADSSISDKELIEFLYECHRRSDELEKEGERLLAEKLSDFSDEVKKAFVHLIKRDLYSDQVRVSEDEVVIMIDDARAYRRSLILHTNEKPQIGKFDHLDFDGAEITKTECGYALSCIADGFENDISVPITVAFQRATVKTEIYNVCAGWFIDTPWDDLTIIASEILVKAELDEEYLNSKEIALIPLLRELRALSLMGIAAQDDFAGFPLLTEYINKRGLYHLLPMLERVTREYQANTVGHALLARFIRKLNEVKCEPLWRELYALIADSQKEYGDVSLSVGKRRLGRVRSQITKELHSLGYEGEYPEFHKSCAVNGLHLEQSYGLAYFLWNEKRARYIIHCNEDVQDGGIHIQFVCGTALLRKDETANDIYSCCFDANGRRLFKELFWYSGDGKSIELFAHVAAKKAECQKLNKQEKDILDGERISWFRLIGLFAFSGGFFALPMTAAMFLLLSLFSLITTGWEGTLEMIGEIPWLAMFVFCFVAFGGSMAIIDAWLKRKR